MIIQGKSTAQTNNEWRPCPILLSEGTCLKSQKKFVQKLETESLCYKSRCCNQKSFLHFQNLIRDIIFLKRGFWGFYFLIYNLNIFSFNFILLVWGRHTVKNSLSPFDLAFLATRIPDRETMTVRFAPAHRENVVVPQETSLTHMEDTGCWNLPIRQAYKVY